jgi:hypothetical protein
MLKYVLTILMYLSLAIIIGSTLFFGFAVAPALFKQGLLPGRTLAGAVNSVILSRMGLIEVAASVVLLLCSIYAAWRFGQWMNWTVLGLSVIVLGAALYANQIVFPRVDQVRIAIGNFDPVAAEKQQLHEEFQQGHQLYSNLIKVVLVGGVLVLILHSAALVRHGERRGRNQKASTVQVSDAVADTPASAAQVEPKNASADDVSAEDMPAEDASAGSEAAATEAK